LRRGIGQIQGRLCRDLGEKKEAHEALDRAATLARQVGWIGTEGMSLLERARVEISSGNELDAIETYQAVIALESQGLFSRLVLIAVLGQALVLAAIGEDKRSLEVLEAARERQSANAEIHEYAEILLLEGQILGKTEPERAERLLVEACSRFSRLGLELETARACMAVSVLLASRGRQTELAGLSAEMAPLLGSETLSCEARCGLEAWRNAVQAGTLTHELAVEISGFFERLHLTLRFPESIRAFPEGGRGWRWWA